MIAVFRLSPTAVRTWRPTWGEVFLVLIGVSIAGFLLAPWSLTSKSLVVLHGLCAQRPSHSFWFGTDRLPFDARMTGIYGGFLVTQLYLLLRRRFRAAGIPSVPILSILLLFIVGMGVDGLNSTLDDIGLFTVYQPTNLLRYITGAFTGTTLAVFLWLLLSNILWRADRQRSDPVIGHIAEFFAIALPLAGFGFLVMSGWQPAYHLLSLTLVVAAVAALFQLSLAFVQLARRRENSASSLSNLGGAAIAALLCAYLFIACASGGRFLMEAALHVKPLA